MAQPQQPPAVGVVRFYNFLPEGVSFLGEVLAGLARPQKTLPPRYCYDAHGHALYEQVCASPGYYPTRSEIAIMREHGAAMAKFLGPDCQLIEFGDGSTRQTRILVEQLQPALYVPVEIDAASVQAAAADLAQTFPWLNINGVCADCTDALTLPEFVGVPIRRKAVYISGSAMGNSDALDIANLLQLARRTVGAGGALLIGVDLNRERQALDAAYNDAAGAAAAFNLNLLERINRELGGDFQLRRFRHRAFYDEVRGRIELHLESLASQLAHVAGERFDFRQGETILTGASSRFGVDEFRALAQRAGFSAAHTWSDDAALFSVHGLIAA